MVTLAKDKESPVRTFQRDIGEKVFKALESDLRDNILKGLVSPDKPILTEPELEKRYKISRKSVRKAIQNLCDEGLLKKIQGRGTFCVPPERRLRERARRSLKILFLASSFIPGEDHAVEYNDALVSGMSEFAYRMNWQLACLWADKVKTGDLLADYKSSQFDGIIWDNAPGYRNEMIATLMGNGIPQVIIDRHLDNICSVCFDHHSEIKETVSFLASVGHKRIALINADFDGDVYRDREEAFLCSLKEAGLSPGYYFKISPKNLFQRIGELTSVHNPPTALILGGHSFLAPFLAWAGSSKLRFPDDLSLVCLDDSYLAKTNDPPISVYAEPRREIGRQALAALERLLNGQMRPGEQIRIKGDLIIRKSCGLPRGR